MLKTSGMRSRSLAGRRCTWLWVPLAVSLQRRRSLRWLPLPAGRRRRGAQKRAAHGGPGVPGRRRRREELILRSQVRSSIPASTATSTVESLGDSLLPGAAPALKGRGQKAMAAKGRANTPCQEKWLRQAPKHRRRARCLLMRPRRWRVSVSPWGTTGGTLLRWHRERRKAGSRTQRAEPYRSLSAPASASSCVAKKPEVRCTPNSEPWLACGHNSVASEEEPTVCRAFLVHMSQPGQQGGSLPLLSGRTLAPKPCSSAGLNHPYVDQTVRRGRDTEGRGENGLTVEKVLDPIEGSAPQAQGTKDFEGNGHTSLCLTPPLEDCEATGGERSEVIQEVAPKNHQVGKKELMELIHEFLEDFYKTYGSFIPLSRGDVLDHLRQKLKSDLSAWMVFISKEVDRYQVVITAAHLPCFTVTHNRHMLTLDDLTTLDSQNWVNDQVINMYGELIMEAVNHKAHFFNTFFYNQLATRGYEGVKRWTKNVDLFSKTLLLIPIHLESHWSLVSVDLVSYSIHFYDSQGLVFQQAMESILHYITTEAKEKQHAAFQRGWVLMTNRWMPQQKNDGDCGVFLLEYCKCLALRRPLRFSQQHMPKIRKRIYKELCECKLTQ
ncbi:sentrin-specific protease 3-like [Scleropages formosus]|nr:sentrin-specific protease 3-like [Scleropages formosus]